MDQPVSSRDFIKDLTPMGIRTMDEGQWGALVMFIAPLRRPRLTSHESYLHQDDWDRVVDLLVRTGCSGEHGALALTCAIAERAFGDTEAERQSGR